MNQADVENSCCSSRVKYKKANKNIMLTSKENLNVNRKVLYSFILKDIDTIGAFRSNLLNAAKESEGWNKFKPIWSHLIQQRKLNSIS